MKRPIGLLILGTLVLWIVVSYPAFRLGGGQALCYSAVAAAFCLVPTVLTLAWAYWVWTRAPAQQLVMILGGTGVRMAFVLGAGLALYSLVPYFRQSAFWVWLLVFYLFTLALEMFLLAGRPAPVSGK